MKKIIDNILEIVLLAIITIAILFIAFGAWKESNEYYNEVYKEYNQKYYQNNE